MKSLTELVQALPRELYDEVYELTFTVPSGIRHVEPDYKPPSCLQVDRCTRNAFAQGYYDNGVFSVNFRVVRKWALSFEVARVRTIKELRVSGPPICVPYGVLSGGWNSIYDFIEERLEHSGMVWSQETHWRIDSEKLKFEVAAAGIENELWVSESAISQVVDEIHEACNDQ